ncbi:MAG: DUF2993 domain-containing protein [Firmicutes bacterium]|jgi:hypothetical protein|nr:DUF2993 domain-containing protein [Bacillota bacterium]MDH7495251.1 DUF2993 domain-containing protein [Bacillota bacterium]
MKYAAALAGLVIICLFLVGEVTIPGVVSTRLERAIAASVDGIESVHVHVRTFPALALAAGKIHSLRLDARNMVVDGLRVRRLFIDARNAEVDVSSVLGGGKLVVRRVGRSDVTVVLAEDDLNSYFHSRDGILRFLTVRLRRDFATVSGSASVLGAKVEFALEGRFVVSGDTRLAYVVDRVTVGRTVVPDVIKDGLLRSVDLSVDVSGLPVPVALKDVNVQDGVAYIFGSACSGE